MFYSVFSFKGRAYFVGIIFKPYQEMKSNTGDLKLGTKVINAIISPPPKEHLKEPVVMLFKKTLVSLWIFDDFSDFRFFLKSDGVLLIIV